MDIPSHTNDLVLDSGALRNIFLLFIIQQLFMQPEAILVYMVMGELASRLSGN